MSNTQPYEETLSLPQKALFIIDKLKTRLSEQDRQKKEPIAIIGMGCRFPGGANTPEKYWQLLSNGVDAVSEVPANRWDTDQYFDPDPGAIGKMYVRHGAFIDEMDRFDADYFDISPREANRMDPQQRLLLEVTYSALEHAGQAPDQLKHHPTGVFIGACTDDYAYMNFSGDPRNIDAYLGLGTARNIAAGRLAHVLGIHGPAIQIDTACSSSLVAAHLACQSLRNHECNMAIVGGVNLMLNPGPTIFFCKVGALAPDGRCKTFDAAANGYVRGEGCGIIILKRLSDALSGGDPIIAVIKGSAVNHDGPSGGLTVPNGKAQTMLIRQALENAAIPAPSIDYIETHGTATALGDAIEINALGEIFNGNLGVNKPVFIGSVKTNIGHLEAVAGLSGLMKVALAISYGEVPPHLHLTKPNPKIQWKTLPFVIPGKRETWPSKEGGRAAGVSSFGFSGTNAHVILTEPAPTASKNPDHSRSWHLLTLSAKTRKALDLLVKRFIDHLDAYPDLNLEQACYTASMGRSHYPIRLAITAQSVKQLKNRLLRRNGETAEPGICTGQNQKDLSPPVTLLFGGNPASVINKGRWLYETLAVFRKTLNHCETLLKPKIGQSLTSALYSSSKITPSSLPSSVIYPVLFAIEHALFKTWQSLGIYPSTVMGSGIGELNAAVAAGIFSLEDGIALAAKWDTSAPSGGKPSKEFNRVIEKVSFLEAETRIQSSISAKTKLKEMVTKEYWIDRPQATEQIAETFKVLFDSGCRIYLEIGKDDVFHKARNKFSRGKCLWLHCIGKKSNNWRTVLESVGALYVQGASIDWTGIFQSAKICKIHLPTYPFQGKSYWMSGGKADRRTKIWSENFQPRQEKRISKKTNEPQDNQHLKSYYKTLAADAATYNFEDSAGEEKSYIRFAPFRKPVSGFSWFLSLANPKKYSKHLELVKLARREMEDVLFRGLDFSAMSRIVDIGCGYARDLIEIAKKYEHLCLDGLNISPDQIAIGRKSIRRYNLQDRVFLHEMDSSVNAFPGFYDLGIGFQIIHHIRNKAGIWANLNRHIQNGGMVILAEILSNIDEQIDHPESSAYFSTKAEWIELLTLNRFRIVECIDASREIGNFLYDPDFDHHLEAYTREYTRKTEITPDDFKLARSHLEGPHFLGSLLRKHVALYGLITIQKDLFIDQATLLKVNHHKMNSPLHYPQVAETVRQGNKSLLYQFDSLSSVSEGNVRRPKNRDLRLELLKGEPSDLRSSVIQYLYNCVAQVLESSADELDADMSLIQLGVDSIMALELKKKLEGEMQVDIPIGVLVAGPTISEISEFLIKELNIGLKKSDGSNISVRQSAEGKETVWLEGEI